MGEGESVGSAGANARKLGLADYGLAVAGCLLFASFFLPLEQFDSADAGTMNGTSWGLRDVTVFGSIHYGNLVWLLGAGCVVLALARRTLLAILDLAMATFAVVCAVFTDGGPNEYVRLDFGGYVAFSGVALGCIAAISIGIRSLMRSRPA